MVELWWSPQITNMLTHHRIIRHHDATKFQYCKFSIFAHFLGTKGGVAPTTAERFLFTRLGA